MKTKKIKMMIEHKELMVQGCKTFVCPNLSIIDIKGKKLSLKDKTIKKAKDLAIKYTKITYQKPKYSSIIHLLPAFAYMASIIENDKRTQFDIARAFNASEATIRKWYPDISNTLDIRIKNEYGEIVFLESGKEAKVVHEALLKDNLLLIKKMIEEGGNALSLKDKTTESAKSIAEKYFKKSEIKNPSIKSLSAAFTYLASILNNDKRRQIDIAGVFDISSTQVGIWFRDIVKALGIKIIYGTNKKIIDVIYETDKNS